MSNLVPIPANAFSAGAVKLDNSEVDRVLMQNTLIRQQARNFAAQKFLAQSTKGIMNQGNGIDANKVDDSGNPDPKGRSDADDFGDAVNDWHNYSVAHQRELSDPYNKNYYNANSEQELKYNHALDIARMSKEKVANLKATASRQKDLEDKGMSFTDEATASLPAAHARVLSNNYKAFDLEHSSANPRPWSQTEDASFAKVVNDIKRIPGQPHVTQDAKTGNQTTWYDNKFDDIGLNKIYSAGATTYQNHMGFQQMIDGIIKNQGQTYQTLKGIFKSEFGRDAAHPEDIAAAYAMSKNGDRGKEPVTNAIPREGEIGQKNAKEIANLQSANTLNREQTMEGVKEKNKEVKQPDVEGYVQGIENRARENGLKTITYNGKEYQGYPVESEPKLKGMSTRTINGHKVEPDVTLFDPVSKTYLSFKYKRNEDTGAPDENNTEPSFIPVVVSREAYKRGLGDKGTENKPPNTAHRPPLDTYVRKPK
jgi:hypothetical protein